MRGDEIQDITSKIQKKKGNIAVPEISMIGKEIKDDANMM